jgi:hypothetical protein
MKHLILLTLLLIPAAGMASGKKTPPASISFHMEGSVSEGPKLVRKVKTIAGERHFRKVPEIGTEDIVAFSPFPADDKLTYGIVFKLSTKATRRLMTTTTMNQGKLLLALVNGQALGVVRIDKPVKDGTLVIWSGIQQQEIMLYDKVAPRIGEDAKTWKKRLKETKKKNKK